MLISRCAAVDRGHRIAERSARREIEADRDRGKLLLVGDRKRRGRAHEARERAQRHLRAAGGVGAERGRRLAGGQRRRLVRGVRGLIAGGGHVELRERGRVALILRHRLQNDAVLVGLPIDGGDLPLAEGVVQCVGDGLHGNAETAGHFAVDVHEHAQAALLRLGRDLAQHRIGTQTRRQLIRPFDDVIRVRSGQRVLVLRAAGAGADLDVLHRLEVNRHAGNRRDQPLQAHDDLVRRKLCVRCAGAA